MAPSIRHAAATGHPSPEDTTFPDVTAGEARQVISAQHAQRHDREGRFCSACGRLFCVVCEGANDGEPCLCERCLRIFGAQLEAA